MKNSQGMQIALQVPGRTDLQFDTTVTSKPHVTTSTTPKTILNVWIKTNDTVFLVNKSLLVGKVGSLRIKKYGLDKL